MNVEEFQSTTINQGLRKYNVPRKTHSLGPLLTLLHPGTIFRRMLPGRFGPHPPLFIVTNEGSFLIESLKLNTRFFVHLILGTLKSNILMRMPSNLDVACTIHTLSYFLIKVLYCLYLQAIQIKLGPINILYLV